MADRFFTCLPFTLAQECPFPNDWSNRKNFSNDKHDSGGATMCGIIQREYDAYRKQMGQLTQPVINITQTEGQFIYLHTYWLPHCPEFPPGGDLVFFDSCVNQGTTEAVMILQFALGLTRDGRYGPKTGAAVANIANPSTFITAFTARRENVYRISKGFQWFGRNWLRRCSEIETAALSMLN